MQTQAQTKPVKCFVCRRHDEVPGMGRCMGCKAMHDTVEAELRYRQRAANRERFPEDNRNY